MVRRAIAILVGVTGLAACGRVGFDPLDPGPFTYELWAAGDAGCLQTPDAFVTALADGASVEVGAIAVGGVNVVVGIDPVPAGAGSVVLTSGSQAARYDADDPPFAVGGRGAGDNLESATSIYVGANRVDVVVTSGPDGTGDELARDALEFTLTAAGAAEATVVEAWLIDDATCERLVRLDPAVPVVAADLPPDVDIELVTSATAGSVAVEASTGGWTAQREDWPPYFVAGDNDTITLVAGSVHELVAFPYPLGRGDGVAGPRFELVFGVE